MKQTTTLLFQLFLQFLLWESTCFCFFIPSNKNSAFTSFLLDDLYLYSSSRSSISPRLWQRPATKVKRIWRSSSRSSRMSNSPCSPRWARMAPSIAGNVSRWFLCVNSRSSRPMVNKQADSFHGELWFFTQKSGEKRIGSLISVDVARFSTQSDRNESRFGRSERLLFWSWTPIMYGTCFGLSSFSYMSFFPF